MFMGLASASGYVECRSPNARRDPHPNPSSGSSSVASITSAHPLHTSVERDTPSILPLRCIIKAYVHLAQFLHSTAPLAIRLSMMFSARLIVLSALAVFAAAAPTYGDAPQNACSGGQTYCCNSDAVPTDVSKNQVFSLPLDLLNSQSCSSTIPVIGSILDSKWCVLRPALVPFGC